MIHVVFMTTLHHLQSGSFVKYRMVRTTAAASSIWLKKFARGLISPGASVLVPAPLGLLPSLPTSSNSPVTLSLNLGCMYTAGMADTSSVSFLLSSARDGGGEELEPGLQLPPSQVRSGLIFGRKLQEEDGLLHSLGEAVQLDLSAVGFHQPLGCLD